MGAGRLVLLFHAHLPFLHATATGNSLQERWLYEAVIESYLPLLMTFRRLRRDRVPHRAVFSLSPPLLAMLSHPRFLQGARRHLDRLLELAERERRRTRGTAFAPAAEWYGERLAGIRAYWDDGLGGDLLGGFREAAAAGSLEMITSAATHGYLPLMQSRQAVRAQVVAGLDEFERTMGRRPTGFWLPECGFAPGIDEVLAAAGIRYFFVDAHVIEHARPRPPAGVHRPVLTPAGVAAFGRDPESSRQVWDRHGGYPGDPVYREFYRDIGWDLPLEDVGPYVLDGPARADTGLKYHRITGPGEHKEPYDPAAAARRVPEHARHFAAAKAGQVERLVARGVAHPVVVAPFDAELFGHWWLEGPAWIEAVFRDLAGGPVSAAAASDCLQEQPPDTVARLSLGSWGAGGYNQVWLNGANDWLYPRLHRAEERMIGLARAYPAADGLLKRALDQAARELLLAQSSDWAFMMTMDSAADYAAARALAHLDAFDGLYREIVGWQLREESLRDLEERDGVFPRLDHRLYGEEVCGDWDHGVCPLVSGASREMRRLMRRRQRQPLRVLMLSWEYPPFVVGGLGRHVAGLSRALAAAGHEVTVVTAAHPEAVTDERHERLRVRRTGPPPQREGDFLAWVYRFNEAVVRLFGTLAQEQPFDLIHAHDWLVGPAAAALQQRFDVPLVATVHATEHGRNGGLTTDLQHAIHREEWRLTHEAVRIIACSRYMMEEISRLFATPPEKLALIPNGIDAGTMGASFLGAPVSRGRRPVGMDHRLVLFVGRLVAEKGVQVLLEAAPSVLRIQPRTLFLIAGRGPYGDDLRALAGRLGLEEHVRFLGHIGESEKHQLMREASAVVVPSLYEPFGIIALEAMAAGAPVVASDTGGLGEIIDHRVTGLKVPPGDPAALARALDEVLTDEALARGLAARAAVRVRERYSWEAVSEQTQTLYEEVLAQLALGRQGDAATTGPGQWRVAGHV